MSRITFILTYFYLFNNILVHFIQPNNFKLKSKFTRTSAQERTSDLIYNMCIFFNKLKITLYVIGFQRPRPQLNSTEKDIFYLY